MRLKGFVMGRAQQGYDKGQNSITHIFEGEKAPGQGHMGSCNQGQDNSQLEL